ncbi:MAG: hypothetical protein KDD60_11065, partial [Bdellovibrionales bacterium]|nr:hypothetical protein [Bdellovibrionales bacterium]
LVNEGEIASAVSTSTPSKACVKLVELAKERGGYDNITVVIVPLNGQLRKESPAGYSAEYYLKRTSQAVEVPQGVDGSQIVRFFIVLGILSVIAMFIALLAIALMIRV